ncbi:hypothetical protein [Mucilaginibacter sp.]|uniref:hypothetical protein n=1 Tax=Mucilaginibacter sp. TaxID=1882438 RepID=UPI003564EC27
MFGRQKSGGNVRFPPNGRVQGGVYEIGIGVITPTRHFTGSRTLPKEGVLV